MAQRQPIVHLREHIRHGSAVFGDHLTVEAIHLVHVVTLVIAARQEKVIRIQQLEAKQCEYAFNAERATINKITVEQIWIRFGWKTIDFEHIHQIVELTVNVAANGEFCLVGYGDVDHGGLRAQVVVDVAQNLSENEYQLQNAQCIATTACSYGRDSPYTRISYAISSGLCRIPSALP